MSKNCWEVAGIQSELNKDTFATQSLKASSLYRTCVLNLETFGNNLILICD